MRTITCLLVAALLAPGRTTAAQSLPPWADSALTAAGLGQTFELASRLTPEVGIGDFDGDGLQDLAVKITAGLSRGLAVVHQIDRSVHIIGAGRAIGNGRSEVPTFGGWGVTTTSHRFFRAGRDYLYLVPLDALPGLLMWTGSSYAWVASQ